MRAWSWPRRARRSGVGTGGDRDTPRGEAARGRTMGCADRRIRSAHRHRDAICGTEPRHRGVIRLGARLPAHRWGRAPTRLYVRFAPASLGPLRAKPGRNWPSSGFGLASCKGRYKMCAPHSAPRGEGRRPAHTELCAIAGAGTNRHEVTEPSLPLISSHPAAHTPRSRRSRRTARRCRHPR